MSSGSLGKSRETHRIMGNAISSIRNLGPATEAEFHKIGVTTAEQLQDLGPDVAYRMLLENGVRPHFIGYYVLVMGLQGRPWNDCKGAEKQALRKRFDQIKATAKQSASDSGISHDLDRALDLIGVRKRDPRA
mgnify:CR=1 FL=1